MINIFDLNQEIEARILIPTRKGTRKPWGPKCYISGPIVKNRWLKCYKSRGKLKSLFLSKIIEENWGWRIKERKAVVAIVKAWRLVMSPFIFYFRILIFYCIICIKLLSNFFLLTIRLFLLFSLFFGHIYLPCRPELLYNQFGGRQLYAQFDSCLPDRSSSLSYHFY